MMIDDRTKVSLYAVACALPFLVGGILWLASIDAKASAAQDELKNSRAWLESIDTRLSHIEGKLYK